ncbi:hypothetical protein BAE44_0009907 [Dichanthelium oligosanthes]|uniref:Uncharacterized protein n=1 Tax=Dichanthelium oligosanthes TaxID=888268 RepID=A0A1E5VVF5_9POAL|nr:hypothetical protein BAE44_0009907 [Dichanthelium oligosanthes]
MASASSNAKQSLCPEVNQSHPDLNTPFYTAPTTSTSAGSGTATGGLYPTIDPNELAENLFPETAEEDAAPPSPTTEETAVAVPGAQFHLVDPDRSLDLGAGTLSVVRLRQGDHTVAVLARLIPKKPHQRCGLFRLFSSGRCQELSADDVGRTLAIVVGILAGIALFVVFISFLRKTCN